MQFKPKPIQHCEKCKKPAKQYNLDQKDKIWLCNKCFFAKKNSK